MPRVKIKVERGNGLQQVVVVDTEATKGATIGTNVYNADGTIYVPGSSGVSANIRSGYGILVSGTNPKTVNVNRGASFDWQGTHAWDLPLRAPTGSAAEPSYTFGAQQDLGLYRVGADTLGIATAAVLKFQVGAAGQWGIGGATYGTAGVPMISGGASAQPSWGTALAIGGGTGFGTYTAGDLLYANSTTTLAKLGVGSAGDLLRVSGGAPAWQAPSTMFANPSATYGANMTGANGSATTGLRSDAVMKIDPAIAPTWTGAHLFAGGAIPAIGTSVVAPAVRPEVAELWFNRSDAGTDEKTWFLQQSGSAKYIGLYAFNDAQNASRAVLVATRSGVVITAITYGNSTNNPTHTFYGQITQTTNILAKTSTTYTNGAAAAAGTLLNAPAAGNPTKWIPVDDNGTTRYIPAW